MKYLIVLLTVAGIAANSFGFTMPTHPPAKKTGHRIDGGWKDKGFQDRIHHAKAAPTPIAPSYPY